MDKTYEVFFEIAGATAMFTRPDSGAAQVSYPAPTFSAAKGMFEAIACLRGDKKSNYEGAATIQPTKVDICAPVRFHKYTTNYGGPLRKSNQMAKGSSYQIPATVLVDVCYRLYGIVEKISISRDGTNHRHYLQDLFFRRLRQGKFYYTPCLGWKEFVPSYVGQFRAETKIQESVNLTIPSMLYQVFDRLSDGNVRPEYLTNVKIERGVLHYVK